MLLTRGDASTFRLAVENAHPLDDAITFVESSHTYYLRGKAIGMSVTGLLGIVETERFDAFKAARAVVNAKKANPRYLKELDDGSMVRMTEKEIMESWKHANVLGTDMHGKFERFLNSEPLVITDTDVNVKELGQFLLWWSEQRKKGFEAYRTEWVIYDEDADLAGSIDFVMRNRKTGELVLIDFKRCLTYESSGFDSAYGGKKLGHPLDTVEATKLNKWKLQVNVYTCILERLYGIRISAMAMIVCHEENQLVEEHWHDRDEGAVKLLNYRIEQVGKSTERYVFESSKRARLTHADDDEGLPQDETLLAFGQVLPMKG